MLVSGFKKDGTHSIKYPVSGIQHLLIFTAGDCKKYEILFGPSVARLC
ncbi:hypothetical protein D1BOALGB6SA_4540 [Olavius sp. associated proteobacterium Delta 1]|nr:hypothetical protein D1BOALGB6SA_4540 [Olavius sp. associated proteobacterium Delta 1]